MIKLTKIEQRMFDLLQANPGKDVRLEELCAAAYVNGKRPNNWRKSVAGMMRYLIMKVDDREGMSLKRTSKLGPGAAATYRFTPGRQAAEIDDLPETMDAVLPWIGRQFGGSDR